MRSLARASTCCGAMIGGSRALVRRGWPLALMRRQVVHRLPFDVDRLAPAFRILAPIWNKTPAVPDYSSAHDRRAIGSLMDNPVGTPSLLSSTFSQ
jgi:hypothetical protein